jgi:hypothetical protein
VRAPNAREAAALIEQLRAIADWVSALPSPTDDATVPTDAVATRCGWIRSVADGFAGLLDEAGARRKPAGRPSATQTLMRGWWADIAHSQSTDTAIAATDHQHPEPGTAITAATNRLEEALATSNAAVIQTAYGPGKTADLVRVHLVWAVVQADDLSRPLPQRDPVPTPRRPVSLACRTLTELLAQEHPGKSVEVRVPPYAAVQCGTGVEGPTHTRGTPPNVVEAQPLTFLRLATGRLSWATARADGLVSASGQRADLSDLLPVLS